MPESGNCYFLGLPAEIRLSIYAHTFQDTRILLKQPKTPVLQITPVGSLLLVNRQINQEAYHLFWDSVTLDMVGIDLQTIDSLRPGTTWRTRTVFPSLRLDCNIYEILYYSKLIKPNPAPPPVILLGFFKLIERTIDLKSITLVQKYPRRRPLDPNEDLLYPLLDLRRAFRQAKELVLDIQHYPENVTDEELMKVAMEPEQDGCDERLVFSGMKEKRTAVFKLQSSVK